MLDSLSLSPFGHPRPNTPRLLHFARCLPPPILWCFLPASLQTGRGPFRPHAPSAGRSLHFMLFQEAMIYRCVRACLNARTGRTSIFPTTVQRSKADRVPPIPYSPSLIFWSLAATACLILYRVSSRLSCLLTARNNTSSPPLLPPWTVPLIATVSDIITVNPPPSPFHIYTHTQSAPPTKGGRACFPPFPLFSSSRPNHSRVHVWSLSSWLLRWRGRHAMPPLPLGLAYRQIVAGQGPFRPRGLVTLWPQWRDDAGARLMEAVRY